MSTSTLSHTAVASLVQKEQGAPFIFHFEIYIIFYPALPLLVSKAETVHAIEGNEGKGLINL